MTTREKDILVPLVANRVPAYWAFHRAGMLAARGVSREWYLNSLHKRGSILPPAPPLLGSGTRCGGRLAFGRGKERVLRLAEISGGDL